MIPESIPGRAKSIIIKSTYVNKCKKIRILTHKSINLNLGYKKISHIAAMKRLVDIVFPDGSCGTAAPYHVSLEGLESSVLCRDDKDYDAMIKTMCVSARRKNVVIIIFVVVSNHGHSAVLAACRQDAEAYAEEVKRIYSMWFSRRYGEHGVMKGVDAQALSLESNSHVRNALAYIPRNAIDNGCKVNEYRWSGYSAMFRGKPRLGVRAVAALSKRECHRLMHTSDDLTGVRWALDERNELIPESFCACWYLEQAFESDQSYFMRVIRGLNSSEMQYELVDKPRKMMTDGEMLLQAEDLASRWFGANLAKLPIPKKIRIISSLWRTCHTTVSQLARVSGFSREYVSAITSR